MKLTTSELNIVVTAITLVLGFCVAGTAQAVVIFETSGGANPTTQGFTAEDIPGGSFDSGPPTNWKMAPAGSPAGYYDYSANLGGLSTALSGTDGWTFTYTYKLNAGYQASTAMTRIKDATNRHEFQFFDGFPNSVPFGIGAGWYYYNNAIQLRQIGTVDPTDGFHTYQETLTHVDGGANDIIDYWLDGVHQLQIPRSGMQGAGGAAQAFFGKATASGSESIDQQVALARFETGIHVVTSEPQVLDRGHQILLNRGLQIEAVAYPPYSNPGWVQGVTDVNRWLSANFTTLNSWWWPMPDTLAQLPAGHQWGRAFFGSNQPDFPGTLTSAELPYANNFASMMYLDEPTDAMLSDNYWLTSMKDWYAYWHENYPSALTFSDTTRFTDDAVLANYMQVTKPDMLVFNSYPARPSDREPWYTCMQKYRTAALAGNDGSGRHPIPWGQFLWMGDVANAPIPTESLVRLNQFANWAFGGTWGSGWMYTSSAGDKSALFSTNGDSSPTPVFGYVAETNRQSRNLGPALVRMLTTDIRMIPGRNGASFNSLPEDISAWSQGTAHTAGYVDHLVSVQPTVSQGGANDTTYSDVLVGYFKPLLTDNSNATFADGLHFMIVNGSIVGTAAQSAQWYRLTFDFAGSDFNSLVRLSRDSGAVELVSLIHTTGSTYYLDLNLPGGTGDLFGFWNSANSLPTIPSGLSGDYNNDRIVDAADYIVWRRSVGTTNTLPNDPIGGTIGTPQYNQWRANFGKTPGNGNGSIAVPEVPEPSSLALVALISIVFSWLPRLSALGIRRGH